MPKALLLPSEKVSIVVGFWFERYFYTFLKVGPQRLGMNEFVGQCEMK